MREKVFAGVSGSHLKVNDFHLVVLCGERAAQPVINTGTIYQ